MTNTANTTNTDTLISKGEIETVKSDNINSNENKKLDLISVTQLYNNKKLFYKSAINDLNKNLSELDVNNEKCLEKLNKIFDNITNSIKSKKEILTKELDNIKNDKINKLNKQLNETKESLENIKSVS